MTLTILFALFFYITFRGMQYILLDNKPSITVIVFTIVMALFLGSAASDMIEKSNNYPEFAKKIDGMILK